jgi:hypothetical protein
MSQENSLAVTIFRIRLLESDTKIQELDVTTAIPIGPLIAEFVPTPFE